MCVREAPHAGRGAIGGIASRTEHYQPRDHPHRHHGGRRFSHRRACLRCERGAPHEHNGPRDAGHDRAHGPDVGRERRARAVPHGVCVYVRACVCVRVCVSPRILAAVRARNNPACNTCTPTHGGAAGRRARVQACKYARLNVVEFMLQHDDNQRIKPSMCEAGLIENCGFNANMSLVRVLVEAGGANVNATDRDGNTGLIAVRGRRDAGGAAVPHHSNSTRRRRRAGLPVARWRHRKAEGRQALGCGIPRRRWRTA